MPCTAHRTSALHPGSEAIQSLLQIIQQLDSNKELSTVSLAYVKPLLAQKAAFSLQHPKPLYGELGAPELPRHLQRLSLSLGDVGHSSELGLLPAEEGLLKTNHHITEKVQASAGCGLCLGCSCSSLSPCACTGTYPHQRPHDSYKYAQVQQDEPQQTSQSEK